MGHHATSLMHPRLSRGRRGGVFGLLVGLFGFLLGPGMVLAQFDLCGCSGNPNTLGHFDTANEATHPPGTALSGNSLTIPLPEDGILIFDRLTIAGLPDCPACYAVVQFQPNATNSPVTILVAGDVTITQGQLSVDGQHGTSGNTLLAGTGGLGGPGGFRGGDGAYEQVNFASDGGAGFGPGGGAPGTAAPLTPGAPGAFIGLPELLPLIGGSGGGGGASASHDPACSGGGGGGGGGAILIAANGTITVNNYITAYGGSPGHRGNSDCASSGHYGSGGAIRLVAHTITGHGVLEAYGFSFDDGAIRLEAITNTFTGSHTPAASRAVPGPLRHPITPTVAITAVNGAVLSAANSELLSERPAGGFGGVDVIVPAPGPVVIDLETTSVPDGTTVDVTIKPRVGGAPSVESVTLTACGTDGTCTASVPVELTSGAYVIEARATFQLP